VLPKKI
jgi:hypothetical protein